MKFRFPNEAQEWKLVALRETSASPILADTAEKIVAYWRSAVETSAYYNADVECAVVISLNSRRRIIGHNLVGIGIVDTVLCHPREVFKIAIVQNAAAVIFVHNHPSGDQTPSEPDIKITKELMRAGQLLKIELLDSIIIGEKTPEKQKDYASLRELGYLYT